MIIVYVPGNIITGKYEIDTKSVWKISGHSDKLDNGVNTDKMLNETVIQIFECQAPF